MPAAVPSERGAGKDKRGGYWTAVAFTFGEGETMLVGGLFEGLIYLGRKWGAPVGDCRCSTVLCCAVPEIQHG